MTLLNLGHRDLALEVLYLLAVTAAAFAVLALEATRPARWYGNSNQRGAESGRSGHFQRAPEDGPVKLRHVTSPAVRAVEIEV